jgi:hypothetical protein
MGTIYETYVDSLSDLKQGNEIELTIRDNTTYEFKKVRAVVSSSPEKLPDGNVLKVRFKQGVLYKQPWAIKISRDLGGLIQD